MGRLTLSLALRFSPGVPLGLACLAGSYAAALESRGVDVDLSATLYAALFFLTAELAYWFGQRPLRTVVRQGRIAAGSAA